MKKMIIILFAMLLVLGFSACIDTTTQKEVDPITIDNEPDEPSIAIEETTHVTTYEKISTYMEKECREAFSPYYEMLDFQISNYEEKVVNDNVEAIFYYKMIIKNYDKDPDTVEYIKEAKDIGDINYQLLYDEYLQPKEGNFHFKVIINENDRITLYSNSSPKGVEWEETEMTDFILK